MKTVLVGGHQYICVSEFHEVCEEVHFFVCRDVPILADTSSTVMDFGQVPSLVTFFFLLKRVLCVCSPSHPSIVKKQQCFIIFLNNSKHNLLYLMTIYLFIQNLFFKMSITEKTTFEKGVLYVNKTHIFSRAKWNIELSERQKMTSS